MNPILLYFARIILIWLLCLLSVLLHELGHALGYRLSGGKAGWKVIAGTQFLFTAVPVWYKVICRGQERDGLQIVHILKQR